jgi:hypothetical protein
VGKGRDGKWKLELVKRLDHIDSRRQGETAVGSLAVPGGGSRSRSRSSVGGNFDAAITCISPMQQMVYTGDEDGRVVSFLPLFVPRVISNNKSTVPMGFGAERTIDYNGLPREAHKRFYREGKCKYEIQYIKIRFKFECVIKLLF